MMLPGGPHIIIKTQWPVLDGRAAMPKCDIGVQGQGGHTVEINTLTSRRGGCSLAMSLLTQPTSGDVTSADSFNNMTGSSSGLNFNYKAVSGVIGETQNCLFSMIGGPEGGTSHTNAQLRRQFICNLAWRPRPASTSHLLLPSVRQSDAIPVARLMQMALAVLRVERN